MVDLYVVAVSRIKALELANIIGWSSKAEAEKHLKEIKAPPTDYVNQYRVYKVTEFELEEDGNQFKMYEVKGETE